MVDKTLLFNENYRSYVTDNKFYFFEAEITETKTMNSENYTK